MSRVLIAGAGVAGAAVALFLRRAGWDVVVVERRSAPDPYAGLFLNIAANGLDVLADLGLREALLGDAHRAGRLVMWSSTGQILGEMPNGPASDPARSGVIVRRGHLHRVLLDGLAAARIPIRYGVWVRALEQDDAGVTATLSDVTAERADILIGADGVRSPTLRFIDPDAPAPRFSGLVGLGGYAVVPELAPTPDQQFFLFGRRSFFGHLVRDDGTAYWFANVAAQAAEDAADVADGDVGACSVDPIGWLARLRELHADDPEPVGRILAATTAEPVPYRIETVPDLPHWSRGRVVAIGDAIHATSPSTGQGASQALEDAAVLSTLLVSGPSPAAFAEFERIRRPRVRKVTRYAAVLDRQKRVTRSRWGIAIRDTLMPSVFRAAARSTRNDWLFTPDHPDVLTRRS